MAMTIIASMTTIPSRIEGIKPVIDAVLAQTVPVERIEINIPYACKRLARLYDIPDWLAAHEGVVIHRTEDYGPITKIAPTLLRYRDDPDTYVWSVDDDFAYPADQLALLLRAHDPAIPRILTRYGGVLHDDGTVQFWYGEADVTMLEAFGGVLYPPRCIGDDFARYVEATSADEVCRRSDDLVLAMYFNHRGLPIHLYNVPTDDAPYMLEGSLAHSKQDALSHAGHAENYKIIHAWVSALLAREFADPS